MFEVKFEIWIIMHLSLHGISHNDKDKVPMISIVDWVFKNIPYEGSVDFFFPVIHQDKLGCTCKRIFTMEMIKDESYYMKVIEKYNFDRIY